MRETGKDNQTMNDVQNLRDLKQLSPTQLRRLIRTGQYTEDTTGLAMGYIQANLAIMPEKYAVNLFIMTSTSKL